MNRQIGGCTVVRTRPSMPTRPKKRRLGSESSIDRSGRALSVRTSPSGVCRSPALWSASVGRWVAQYWKSPGPRLPCFKLGLRMEDSRFPQLFATAGRPGAYLRIVREGDVGADDRVEVMTRPAHGVTCAVVAQAILGDPSLLTSTLDAPELPADVRTLIRKRIAFESRRGLEH